MSVLEPWQAEIVKLNMSNYLELDGRQDIIESALAAFYLEMNQNVRDMKLRNTNFMSAHGMHHDMNYSSGYDIALISHHCMKNQTFR